MNWRRLSLAVVLMLVMMAGALRCDPGTLPLPTPTGDPTEDIEPDQVDLDRATKTNEPPTATEKAAVLYAREQQKLARDLYQTLGTKWSAAILQSTAQAEQKHMDTVKSLIDGLGLTDPAQPSPGQFTDPVFQKLYGQLLDRGSTSLVNALNAAAYLEEMEIRDTRGFVEDANRLDIIRGLGSIATSEPTHLRVFVAELKKQGVDYQPQLLSQSDYDRIMKPAQS
jgi:hypothetical protein